MNHVQRITLIVKSDFKTSMLRSSLCDYSDSYIPVKGTITVANKHQKKVIFKNCVPFTSCISTMHNTKLHDAQYIDVAMPMYNLIEYSDNYSKTSGILFRYCRDDNNDAVTDFIEANVTNLFNLKEKLTGQTGENGTKNVEIIVSLKNLSNFWRILEIPLINCEITIDLNWSENCVIAANNAAAQAKTFSIIDTKNYVPMVTLLTQDNAKLLEQLKSGFKRTVNWKKYQTKVSTERVH